MSEAHTALTSTIILLLVGILSITLMRRIRLSPIVGYLAAGILIGPHAFGLIRESEITHLLAELGVAFLLFDIGLHFSLSSIWEARRDIFGLGPLQILLCGLAFGGIFIAFGVATEYAIILGGALALSSTAVVVQTLAERGQQSCPVGLTGLAVLIFQDIFAIFLLVLASSLGGEQSSTEPGLTSAVSMAAVKSIIAFLAALLISHYAIKPIFRLISQTKNEEVFTAMALLVVLATATATSIAGLSLTLGAFLGGMIISETPHRHIIQTEAKPFRNLLLGFFFITVGMSLDWHLLLAHSLEILVFLVILIVIKVLLIAVAARAVGWSIPGSVQLSFLLAQGSEFAFVIIALPIAHKALSEITIGIVIMGIAASLVLTPTLAALGNTLARLFERKLRASLPSSETTPNVATPPVIVFGMDDIGRTVADALEAHGVPYDAVEGDYESFLSASADGYPVAFGDLGDLRLMETLSYAEREAIIVSIASYELARALTPTMHERYPNLPCFVGVSTDEDKALFKELGLRPVINRSVPRGLDLAAEVLRFMKIDDAKTQTWMRRQQERLLQASASSATHVAI